VLAHPNSHRPRRRLGSSGKDLEEKTLGTSWVRRAEKIIKKSNAKMAKVTSGDI
jgi:hypothetical protein